MNDFDVQVGGYHPTVCEKCGKSWNPCEEGHRCEMKAAGRSDFKSEAIAQLATNAMELEEAQAEIERLEKELDGLHSWQGVMAMVDKVYPAWLIPDDGSEITEINYTEYKTIGVVVINLIRRIDGLRAENERLEKEVSFWKRTGKGII